MAHKKSSISKKKTLSNTVPSYWLLNTVDRFFHHKNNPSYILFLFYNVSGFSIACCNCLYCIIQICLKKSTLIDKFDIKGYITELDQKNWRVKYLRSFWPRSLMECILYQIHRFFARVNPVKLNCLSVALIPFPFLWRVLMKFSCCIE